MPLGPALVHPHELAGEQGGLGAALPRADLDDGVAVVVRVPRDQHQAQHVGRLGGGLLQGGQLLAEAEVVGGELAGGAQVVVGLLPAVVGRDHLAEHGVAAGQAAGQRGVAVDGGVGEGVLHLGVLVEQRSYRVEHLASWWAGRGRSPVRSWHDDGARPDPWRGAGGRRDGCYLAASAGAGVAAGLVP